MPVFEVTSPDGRKFRVTGPEGSTQEQALQQIQSQYKPEDAPKPLALGRDRLDQDIADTAKDFSGPSKFMVGAAGAINSAAMRLKQLLGRELTPEDIQGLREYKALEKASGAAVAGDVGMNVLATLNPGAALYRGGAAVAGKVLLGVLAKPVGAAVSGGAITAATQPTMEGETGLGNAGMGAAFSTAADVATRGAARVAQPIVQSPAVQKLVGEKVIPTLGQASGGLVNRIEQALESVPVVGWMITGGRNRAVKELDEAAIRKALPEGTTEQIKAGRAGIERAEDILDTAYDSAYSKLTGKVKIDTPFYKSVGDIPKKEGIDLPPSLAERFNTLMQD